MAPSELAKLVGLLRQRAGDILDGLPVGKPVDWVHSVSIPLTTAMLATLTDFPWEERHKLPVWSDWAAKIDIGEHQRRALASQPLRRRPTDARCRAGYQRRLALKTFGHALLSPVRFRPGAAAHSPVGTGPAASLINSTRMPSGSRQNMKSPAGELARVDSTMVPPQATARVAALSTSSTSIDR